VSDPGNGSGASEAPGVTGKRPTTVQVAGAVFSLVRIGAVTGSRQITAVIAPLMRSLSVVRSGVVQCSLTSSPTRVAVSPEETSAGRLRVGGSGGPGLAHPARRVRAIAAADVMRRGEGKDEKQVPLGNDKQEGRDKREAEDAGRVCFCGMKRVFEDRFTARRIDLRG
jgi:hypothetical protein